MSRHFFPPGFAGSVMTVDGTCPLAPTSHGISSTAVAKGCREFPRDTVQVGKRTLIFMFLGARYNRFATEVPMSSSHEMRRSN